MRDRRVQAPALPVHTSSNEMNLLRSRPTSAGLVGMFLATAAVWACRATPPDSVEGLMAVNGTELFVKRVGSGPPMLVIHGGPLMDHGYLLPWLEPLSRERELIYFDQRLSGRSRGTADSASVRLDTLVADMEEIRQALGLERWDLMAHSWGGLLAQRYAILHPERVASMAVSYTHLTLPTKRIV